MLRSAYLVILPVLFLSIFVVAAQADNRIALVIGNGAYQNAPRLPNPRNDAQDVAASLKRSGFETILGLDLDQAGMQEAAIKFSRVARAADVAIFYYSGHALQYAGTNYLAPIDAKLNDEADLRRMTKVDEIVADLQQAKNLRILILDSCRDNPLEEQLRRSIGATRAMSLQRGLAKIDSPQGMIVAYATQAGRTAEDGDGRNSPYTAAFLKHIEEQEEIGTVFRRVSSDVYETTKHTQLPELSLSLIGEFYLRGRLDITFKPTPSLPDACAAAGDHWKSAEAIGSVAAFQDHLARFPNCVFAGLARARIAAIEKPAIDAKPAEDRQKVAIVTPPKISPSPCGGPVSVSLSSRAAQPLSASEECGLQPKNVFKECDQCPEMIVVPAGSFKMGSPPNEEGHNDTEEPQHLVTFAKAFAVGRFAVTFDEWDACVADGGCGINGGQPYRPRDEGWGRGRQPAIGINWDLAKAYVLWLSRRTGKNYRLLSEAEREYVARAGTATPFWWGGSISTNQANYEGRFSYGNGPEGESRKKTVSVDSFGPNPWGLFQVHGNVWEWVEDCWNESYAGAPTDGSAWLTGNCTRFRATRGGSWKDAAFVLRSANRGHNAAYIGPSNTGFRVARAL
jgi:formylglycine-generating enzyme required for sulfatase activity